MKQHQNIWLPDHEQHIIAWMTRLGEVVGGKGTYQIKKLRLAMRYTKDFRNAIDVGAHVGMWTMRLSPLFAKVDCFEPIEEHSACWLRNVEDAGCTNVALYPYALGAYRGSVAFAAEQGSSGNTFVHAIGGDGEFEYEMRPLDQFEFKDVDFMKIDCEGFETEVVKGAEETIRRDKPCIIVEQKPHVLQRNYNAAGTPAVDLLVSWGAVVQAVTSGDYVLTWAK